MNHSELTSDLTCLTCGKALRWASERVYPPSEGRPNGDIIHATTYRNVRASWAKAPGYMGNGLFCTLRCGFDWAMNHAAR
jgi:hypothetical protein